MINELLPELSDLNILIENSKNKLKQFQIDPKLRPKLTPNIKKLLDDTMTAFLTEIDLEPKQSININELKNIFIDFNQTFNSVKNSKFEKDVNAMNGLAEFHLKIGKDVIRIYFLVDDINKHINNIASILHALNTFCYLFPHNYHHLVIYICLDDNMRNIDFFKNQVNPTSGNIDFSKNQVNPIGGNIDFPKNQVNLNNAAPKNKVDYENIFDYLRKTSSGFNVSGVTYRSKQTIILTKSEEIIKLMYHEMVHYIGLDHELLNIKHNFNWAMSNSYLNLSEAYTEFLSILLYSAYETIHVFGLKKIDIYELYEKILFLETNYSIYLSCNILKFYGYDNVTVTNFFEGIGEKHFSPILVSEYIILRSQLFLNIDAVSNLLGPTWMITQNNKNHVLELMKTDNNLINKLSLFMEKTQPIKSVSYVIIDFDWNLV